MIFAQHKSLLVIIAIIVLSVSAIPAIASELTGSLGISIEDPKGKLDRYYGKEYGLDFHLLYHYNTHFGLRSSLSYHQFKTERSHRDFLLIPLTLNGVVSYPVWEGLRISGFAGMGIYYWQAEKAWWRNDESAGTTDLGINYGVQLDYRLMDDLGLYASFEKHRFKPEGSGAFFDWFEWSAGLRFKLDKAKTFRSRNSF